VRLAEPRSNRGAAEQRFRAEGTGVRADHAARAAPAPAAAAAAADERAEAAGLHRHDAARWKRHAVDGAASDGAVSADGAAATGAEPSDGATATGSEPSRAALGARDP